MLSPAEFADTNNLTKSQSHTESHANRACTSCKVKKRGCDRRIPKCSLCLVKNWECIYSRRNPSQHQSKPITSLTASTTTATLPRTTPLPNDFPSVYFLDHSMFHRAKLQIPPAFFPVSNDISTYVGSNADIRAFATRYFDTVQTWLPFISKKRFYDVLLNPLARPRTDYVALFACMKLVLSGPINGDAPRGKEGDGKLEGSGVRNEEYLMVKRWVAELQDHGIHGLQMLQAGMLVTVFEIVQCIYPAAFLSVAWCARMAVSLGVDFEGEGHEGGGGREGDVGWLEKEEKIRVWWTILILDRFVSLGRPSRPLSTSHPRPASPLPVEDAVWDAADLHSSLPPHSCVRLSTPPGVPMCQFARLAQATNLVSFTLAHISDQTFHPASCEDEVMQLDRTLHSLIELMEVEIAEKAAQGFKSCGGLSLCRSALTILHGYYLSIRDKTAMSASYYMHATNTLRLNADKQATYIKTVSARGDRVIDIIPPLSFHWMYQATIIQERAFKETGDVKNRLAADSIRAALQDLSECWESAGAYLKILEAREVMGLC